MDYSAFQGVALGVIISGVFAWSQSQALRRNELLEKRQQLPTLPKQIPGSGVRVAFLLTALVLVQVFVPSAGKWWLTASLTVSYGIRFLSRLKHLRAPAR